MQKEPTLTIPLSIVIAGIIVGGAIFFSRAPQNVIANNGEPSAAVKTQMRPVDATDHLLGNPEADLIIVEYSDTECPFCKRFHPTMQKIMDEYGKTGKVAWVYRYFPLDIHPKATTEANALECAASLGGNTAFWDYVDRIYEITPANNGLDLAVLPQIAQELGFDVAKFNECLANNTFTDRVKADYADGLAAGVDGTPHSLIVTKDGKTIPIRGAQPYEAVKATLEALLK